MRWKLLLFLGALVAVPEVSADGRLDSARDEIRESSDREKNPPDRRDSEHCDDDDDAASFDDESDAFHSFLGEMLLYGATAPWWGPRSLLDDRNTPAELADFPYASTSEGLVVEDSPSPSWSKPWSGRFTVERGDDFDGLRRLGGRLQLETMSRFGLDTEWSHRNEAFRGKTDSLWTGDFNLVYRFAQHPRAAFYSGIGVNWLADTQDAEVGFNFTYGLDWFPARPWVISGNIDWGRLGDASLFHGRTTLGVMLNRFELFTGYDHFNVEGAKLDGWLFGARIWF